MNAIKTTMKNVYYCVSPYCGKLFFEKKRNMHRVITYIVVYFVLIFSWVFYLFQDGHVFLYKFETSCILKNPFCKFAFLHIKRENLEKYFFVLQ